MSTNIKSKNNLTLDNKLMLSIGNNLHDIPPITTSNFHNPQFKNLLTDKIFQYFYFRTYNSHNYDEFIHLKDSEKVTFLINLFLFVNKKDFNHLNPQFSSSKIKSQINFSKNLSLLPTDLLEKLNTIKNENRKQELLENFNNFKMLSTNKEIKFKSDFNEEEIKSKLDNIRQKYCAETLNCSKNTVETKDVKTLISKFENKINGKESVNSNPNALDAYIKDDSDIIHTQTINNGEENENNNYLNHNNAQTYNNNFSKLNEINEAQNNILIPCYATTFYKIDFYKSKKITLEDINKLEKDFYLVDNREIFTINNFGQFNDFNHLKSTNNKIENNFEDYKKLSKPHQKAAVRSLNIALFKKNPGEIFTKCMTKSN
jgi:hypothetical protein